MNYRVPTPQDKIGIINVFRSGLNIATDEEAGQALEAEMMAGHHFIVAEDNGQIVGLVSEMFHGRPRHGLVELDHIVVLPDYRGKGVAQELFDELVKASSSHYLQHGFKLRKLFLLTHADNVQAQKFYIKLGLKQEARLKKHFYDDKDELVLSKFFD